MGNPTKDTVFKMLAELEAAVQRDSFNLTRNSQEFIEMKLKEFREILNSEYNRVQSR